MFVKLTVIGNNVRGTYSKPIETRFNIMHIVHFFPDQEHSDQTMLQVTKANKIINYYVAHKFEEVELLMQKAEASVVKVLYGGSNG